MTPCGERSALVSFINEQAKEEQKEEMGNWTSTDQAKGKRSNLPITEEEWNKHEGNNYVIFPHYLEDADDAAVSFDDGQGLDSQPRRGPRWSHIEAVLQRKIEDVDQFEKGAFMIIYYLLFIGFLFSFK